MITKACQKAVYNLGTNQKTGLANPVPVTADIDAGCRLASNAT